MCVLQRSFWLGTPCHLCKGTVKECKADFGCIFWQHLLATMILVIKCKIFSKAVITIALYVKTSKR